MKQGIPGLEHEETNDETELFTSLLNENSHRIRAFIAKQLAYHADVEDVFQISTLVIWRKFAEFDRKRSFFHWACGIAYNEIRNHRTIKRRDRHSFDLDLIDTLAEEARDEEELSMARLAALKVCISKLSNPQQALLKHSYNSTASISDIAKSLGLNRDSLYKRLSRLRALLLKCIRNRLTSEGVSR